MSSVRISPAMFWTAILSGALLLSGCLEVRNGAENEAQQECTACHGSADRPGTDLERAAPPTNIDGQTATTAPGVGAHQRHLDPQGRAAPVACEACHVVPDEVYAEGHVDSPPPAEVVLGGLAAAGDDSPSYDPDTGTCAVYCHGAGQPAWLDVRAPDETCGTCHGLPPAAPHPQREDCSACHGEVIAADGTFAAPERHVDGNVDVADLDCSACHGRGRRGAPPPDRYGNEAVSARGVGAHAFHLEPSDTHGVVACGECHEVPDEVNEEGHIDDGPPADVVFGDLARADDHEPEYDAAALTCAGSYCHGEAVPVWTEPRDSEAACGSCHGLPPPSPHPEETQCSNCHGAVIGPDGTFVARERHVDGRLDMESDCSGCHGTGPLGAPPPDVAGHDEVSARGVGAHARHLEDSPTHAAVECSECHVVPASVDAPGHFDSSPPAEITFGALATADGSDPVYDADELTCAGSYCHGSDQPVWNEPLDVGDTCGTCHGLPPPPPHPAVAQCSRCHGEVIGDDGTFVAPERHVDGIVDVAELGCASCHGTTGLGAPPPDLEGNTDVSAPGVGAHQLHLQASSTHAALACTECHRVPAAIDDTGHIDATRPADLTFGTLATTAGASPAYDAQTRTCLDSYCHGDGAPVWNEPRSSGEACGSCHGLPPPAPHPASDQCSDCHGTVIDATGTFIAPELHVNGTVDLGDLGCSACHGQSGLGAPPPDLAGSTATSAPGVGAHSVHLQAAQTHGAVACGECHQVPSSVEAPGHIDASRPADVVFGPLAGAEGSTPAFDADALTCAGSYCHGSATPVWNDPRSSSEACGTCHEVPPPPPHPASDQCGACHGEVIDLNGAFVAPERHVDGTVDVSLTCHSCHGTGSLGGPPPDLSGSSDPSSMGVGAHAQHLEAGTTHDPVACGECHVVPGSVGDAGHIDDLPAEVTFGTLASSGGATPSFSRTGATCADTYCHGASIPVWTSPRSSSQACGSCHGLPPPAPHPPVAACERCHGEVVGAGNVFVDTSLHVNGTVDVQLDCNSCHGSSTSDAPPVDLEGNTSVSAEGVGAHQVHLQGSRFYRPVQCDECHVVPAAVGDAGHIDDWGTAEVTFSGVAVAGGAAPSWDSGTLTCSDSWCHGPEDRTSVTPAWNSGQSQSCLGSCHGYPPASHDPGSTACADCHSTAGTTDLIAIPEQHVDGNLDF